MQTIAITFIIVAVFSLMGGCSEDGIRHIWAKADTKNDAHRIEAPS
jgi:hypothetical protein